MTTPSTERARRAVEGAAAGLEKPVERLVGSPQANPLPHAGTISVFLLIVVVLSGVYITLFYEFGFEASHQAVADMDDHPIQGVVRSIHRYASAALVLTTIVHGWRIFVAGRFGAGRRYRWLTGIASLVLVWLAGVTGYLLVWDARAQAIAEAAGGVLGDLGLGGGFVVDQLLGRGSGSGLTVAIWFVHLGLTAVLGWFAWRHLRRSRLAWLPPRAWMIAMGVALLVLSVLLPADLLAVRDPGALVPDMALDPFMLFLLPPLLSDAAWLVVAAMAAAILVASIVPWVLRDRTTAVVAIDPDACTGCEICVEDCPYLALEMRARPDDPAGGRLAVVDPSACVGCGICVGSCAFGAMELPGHASPETVDPTGADVVVVCERRARHRGHDGLAVTVPCAGMLQPAAIGHLMRRGAASVSVDGCSPGDCSFGVGNLITHERLDGSRAPHVQRRWAGSVVESWGDAGADAFDDHAPLTRRNRAAAATVVGVSMLGVGAATLLPFGGDDAEAAVRVLVSHEPGAQLIGQVDATGDPSADVTVVISVDGQELVRETVGSDGARAVGVVDADVAAGDADLRVTLEEGGTNPTELYDGPARFTEGRRFLLEARDVPPAPGAKEGRDVFDEPRLGGCAVCHETSGNRRGVGPSLAGVATRAATTVPGLDAAEYLVESIVDPDAFIVDGYRAGQMLPTYTDRLSASQIDALVQYLLTLEAPA